MAKDASSQGATAWREGRRLRAVALSSQGWTQQEIADALGVTQGAVSQWLSRAREGGVTALRHRKPPGRPPRLNAPQRAWLLAALRLGAEAWGFRGEVWTRPRVAAVIEQLFGVRYHPSHVGRLLAASGWSPQRPVRRAHRRDDEAIEAWRTRRWPELEKSAPPKGARRSS